jgi:hypothetical protein
VPKPRGSRWADLRHLLRRSRKRPLDAAQKALRSTNSPVATTSANPPFAARREPHDQSEPALTPEPAAVTAARFRTADLRGRTIVALIWFRLASRTEEKYKQSRTAGDGPPWRDPCARSAE